MTNFSTIATWYALSTLIAIALAPLAFMLFHRLNDHGAGFVRPVAMLAFTWPAWLLAGINSDLVPFGRASLWVSIAVLGVVVWGLGWRTGAISFGAFGHLLVAESGYLAAFALYVWYRGFDPNILGTEKLSDLMMLSSSMRAESMPPPDAWMAGNTINYYYVGYLPWASLGRLANIPPALVYNLTLTSIFATTFVAIASVAANVIGRFFGSLLARASGAIAAVFLFMATPWALSTAIQRRDTIWNERWWDFMWPASRQLEAGQPNWDAISEFPAFSFQLGDLHPHVLSLPFTILALGFAWMLVTIRDDEDWGPTAGEWARIIIAGAFVGGLYAMNSWDLPAYLLIALVGLAVGTANWNWRSRVIAGVVLVASALGAWLPFYANFSAPTAPNSSAFGNAIDGLPVIGAILASISGYSGPETTPWQFIGFAGFPWAVGLALIARELWARRDVEADPLVSRALLGAGVVLLLGGLLLPRPMLILAGIPVALVIYLWHKDATVSPANVSLALLGAGLTLMLIPDFVYLLDIYDNRMNIVFKLYYQGWVMLAIAAAIAIAVMIEAARNRPWIQAAVSAVACLVVAGGLAGTVIGMHQWNQWPNETTGGWKGVNGFAYLETDPYWAGQQGSIDWLLDNARTNDVMLTAGGCEFSTAMGITASGTGIPTILGWEGHEQQWHLGETGFVNQLAQRATDITDLFSSPDPALLNRYGVTLIVIGPIERTGSNYPNDKPSQLCAPGPFPNANDPNYPGTGWTQVYTDDTGTRIYRRDGS